MKKNKPIEEDKNIEENKNNEGVQFKKRPSIRNILSLCCIFAGLTIIAIPIVGRVIANKQREDLIESFYLELENNQSDQANSNDLLGNAFDWGSNEDNQEALDQDAQVIEDNGLKDSDQIKAMPKVIGLITIKDIDVKLPISEGVDLETLRFAVGHMPGTVELGEIGNSVLAGHRGYTYNTYFNRLDELENGDKILVELADGTAFTYVVYETLIVQPDDLSVLNNFEEHKTLTLITCHPKIKSNSRLIIHAIEESESL